MKKTILLSSLFAVGAAFAGEVTNANAVAALGFAVTKTAAQTLVAVPFEGFEEGGKVKVNDIVKTSNLGDGSKLYVPNAEGKYDTWTLTEGEWVANVQVEIGTAGTPVEKKGVESTGVSVDRGDAFWIQPAEAGTIFLLGQGVADDDGQSTAAKGWNLIGNASVKPVQLKNLKGTKGDQIVVQVDGKLRYYSYNRDMWTYPDPKDGSRLTDDIVIKPGQGFWYKRTADSDDPIDWGKGESVPVNDVQS